MDSRERITALLNREIPDRMGLFEHYWPETLSRFWPEQGYPRDTDPADHFGYDMTIIGGSFLSEPFTGRADVVEEDDRRRLVRDGRGATLRYWKEKSGTPEHVAFEVTTPEKWKEYREPLLETNRDRLWDLEGARTRHQRARSQGKYVLWANMFVFEQLRAMLGDQHFLPALLTDPAWIHDFCQVYLDFYLRHYELLFQELERPDGIFIYEDWGYRNGLFCSPASLRELILPYEKALVDYFKSHGVQVIIHSCGDIRQAIPLFIEAGFDCLQPMEAKAGCDVIEIAKTYGNKIAYMGNIDVVELSANDPVRVRQAIEPKLAEMRRLRAPYIFHSDHSIPPDVRLDTYRLALEIFEAGRRY